MRFFKWIGSVALSVFSANGEISSARVGYYVALASSIVLVYIDMILNGSLNETVTLAILAAGTGGYGITKASEVSTSKHKAKESSETPDRSEQASGSNSSENYGEGE